MGKHEFGPRNPSMPERESIHEQWKTQANRLLELKFHTKLGLSKEEYLDSLPQFTPQPEKYKGVFDIPLLVDQRVPLQDQYQLANIASSRFIVENLVTIPDKPYAIWTHDGKRNRSLSINEARASFNKDEEGSPLIEAVALYIQKPDLLRHHGVDASGSSINDVFSPSICAFGSIARVSLTHNSTKFPESRKFGALSRGKTITQ